MSSYQRHSCVRRFDPIHARIAAPTAAKARPRSEQTARRHDNNCKKGKSDGHIYRRIPRIGGSGRNVGWRQQPIGESQAIGRSAAKPRAMRIVCRGHGWRGSVDRARRQPKNADGSQKPKNSARTTSRVSIARELERRETLAPSLPLHHGGAMLQESVVNISARGSLGVRGRQQALFAKSGGLEVPGTPRQAVSSVSSVSFLKSALIPGCHRATPANCCAGHQRVTARTSRDHLRRGHAV